MSSTQTTNQNQPESLVQFLCVHLDAYIKELLVEPNSWESFSIMNDIVMKISPEPNSCPVLSQITSVFRNKVIRVTKSHESVIAGIRMFFEALTFRALRCQLPEPLIRKWLTTGTILDDFFDPIIANYMGAIADHNLIPYDELINEVMPELVCSTRECRIDAPEDLVPYLTSFYQEEYRALNCRYPIVRIAHEIWSRYQEMRATQPAVVPSSPDNLGSLLRTQTGMIENLCKQVENISVLCRVLNSLLQTTEARLEKIEARLERFEARLEQTENRVMLSVGRSDYQPDFGHF